MDERAVSGWLGYLIGVAKESAGGGFHHGLDELSVLESAPRPGSNVVEIASVSNA